MSSLVFFVEQISLGLYILSMGGILLMAYQLQRARHELAVAQFKLEREQAQVRQATAVTFGGLLIEIMIGVWAITNVMAPTVRDRTDVGANNQPKHFYTSTPMNNPAVALGASGDSSDGEEQIIFATPVPTNTPVGTILPEAEDAVGCARDSAWIHIPGNGQLIFEATTVQGIATVSNFAFYRFEIKPVAAGAEFAPIGGDYTAPVTTEGPLGDILPFVFSPGEYRFRLTVFDNTRIPRALCEITIHISDPPPTPTPIGGEATPPA